MKATILYGITLSTWVRLLRQNGFRIHLPYLHRAAALTAGSAINSILSTVERTLYRERISAARPDPPPVFIIGHWRSGTTLLQTLLSLDDRLATPNTYQVIFPHAFLTTERVGTALLKPFVPPRRVEGDMPLHLTGPKEDEIALTISSLCSPYLGVIFPRHELFYRRYLTLTDIPAAELERWKASLVLFVKKLTVRYGCSIVLKSPPHTARIRLLLELFPGARFVHIHRHPYEVFQSARHMFESWQRHAAFLQRPHRQRVDERILELYETMYDAYFNDVRSIPDGQHCSVRFDVFKRDIPRGLRYIYERLNLPGYSQAAPRFGQYAASAAGHRQAIYPALDDDTKQAIVRRWRRSFDAWSYST